MELNKYRLQKKWWQGAGKYTIMDSSNKLVFVTKPTSIFKVGISLEDLDRDVLLQFRSTSMWNSSFTIESGHNEVAFLQRKSVLSSKEYLLSIGSRNLLITAKNWGKQMNFMHKGIDIAHASAKGSMWNKIGVVINADEEQEIILASVVIICYMKANGYA